MWRRGSDHQNVPWTACQRTRREPRLLHGAGDNTHVCLGKSLQNLPSCMLRHGKYDLCTSNRGRYESASISVQKACPGLLLLVVLHDDHVMQNKDELRLRWQAQRCGIRRSKEYVDFVATQQAG